MARSVSGVKVVTVLVVVALLSAAAMAAMARRRPVLLSISPDPTEVRPRHYCVMNPFRDRSPERAAERHLAALRDGRTETLAGLVEGAELEHMREAERRWPVRKWRVGRRRDDGNGTDLMYWVERVVSYGAIY